VVIAASPFARAEQVEPAATGNAVFCEKPMGMTLDEVDSDRPATGAAPLQVGQPSPCRRRRRCARLAPDEGRHRS
jgi:hypothetical protein